MASSDPNKTRDFERSSDRENYDADEDPLVELARIVSEDGGFSGRMSARAKVEPVEPDPEEAPEPAAPRVPQSDYSSDLEAELMQELETSFSTRAVSQPRPAPRYEEPEPVAPPLEPEPEPVEARAPHRGPEPYEAPEPYEEAPEPYEEAPESYEAREPYEAPEPVEEPMDEPEPAPFMAGPAIEEPVEEAPPAPRDDPDDLLRSIEEQLSQFERRVRSDVFVAEDETSEPEAEPEDVDWSGGHREVEAEAAPEPRDWREPEPEAPRTEYRFRGPAGPGWNRDVEPESEAEDFAEPSYAPRSTAEETERAALFGRDLSESDDTEDDRADYAEEARRRIAGEPGLRGTFAGAGAAAASSDARDFASLEAELSRELDTGAYAGTGTGVYADRHATEDDVAGTDSDDDVPIAPAAVIAPEHGMRPPPPRPASAAAPAPRRFRPGWGMIAAAVVVLAAGAAVAVYLRSFDQAPSGPPPVIAAPDGPVKIEPAADETASGEETVGEAVYDRVAGEGSQTQETMVDGAEEPQELARIVPPSAESDTQMAPATDDTAMMPAQGGEDTMTAAGSSDSGAAPVPATQQAAEEDFGPRQVQTYVVRADGSIVTTEEAGGQPQQPDLSAQQLASAQTEAVEPTPVQTVVIDKPQVAGSSVTEETTMSPAPAASAPSTDTGSATAEALMEPEATETPSEPATNLAELRTSEEPAPEAPAPEATQSAATEEPAAAAVPATATSGYVVQLSATGSPEEAQTTYSRLQRNYASILGNLDANIQRADLGDRGIFYRVRVGPWAQRGDAVAVCESLKAAGADCFVTQ